MIRGEGSCDFRVALSKDDIIPWLPDLTLKTVKVARTVKVVAS